MAEPAGVVAVSPDEMRTADTSSTPAFLGLDAPGGLWDQLGGVGSAGDGVIIGIIDTGIWPESLSFSDRDRHERQRHQGRQARLPADPRLARQVHARRAVQRLDVQPEADRRPVVQRGLRRQRRHRRAATRGSSTPPRDFGGHGTHTASTAGGNDERPDHRRGRRLRHRSAASRRTPASPCTRRCGRLAPGQGSGYNTDLVAAIDQAVADGVDVINYSISGTPTNFARPGRDLVPVRGRGRHLRRRVRRQQRPGDEHRRPPRPVDDDGRGRHPQPQRRGLRDARQRRHLLRAPPWPPPSARPRSSTPTAAGLAGADRRSSRCATARRTGPSSSTRPRWPARSSSASAASPPASTRAWPSRRPAAWAWSWSTARDSSLNADFHFVPTVHVSLSTDRTAIKAYAATAGATATINQATIVYDAAGAVHGVVLVARPAPRRWRRPAQAGPHRPRPGHPGRRRAARQRRPRLRPLQRHLDVQPARGRPRGAADGPPSRPGRR